ncbi:efflux RND transporter periplasmic adaptor subunit [Acidihalobacter prosperus]|uniref:MexH family multidrug efflux RND transporter periplasmic adaptor subunit n=1 Tax=Acidihalobacter prosperus TaxID=160660 RepID=A0A1A6C196_9GAMM|nr:efflux RND transporter periplasmic adaptor subunit [Acidihalobacter prosperus]OBS08336.1 MexH family multidrug efflux RND transporter periplasmic adaptor subunit [Acidihalobacter prosperus]
MKKRLFLMVMALALVFGGVFGWGAVRQHFINQYFANFQPPPQTVASAEVREVTWQPEVAAVGGLVAVHQVAVATDAEGLVTEVDFASGDAVKRGQLLVRLDDSLDRAMLKGNQAALALARLNYERERRLLAQRATSQTAFDTAQAQYRQAQAQVEQTRAMIEKKQIRAPFDGVLGIRDVDVGRFLAKGAAVATLQSLNPIYADFTLPQQELPRLAVGQTVRLSVDAYPLRDFTGSIKAIDPAVSAQSRSVRVRVEVPNADRLLRPGLFVQGRFELPGQQHLIAVPASAIDYNPYGDSVFVIREAGKDDKGKPRLTVTRTYVRTGESRDGWVTVSTGLKAGEQVVSAGQMKLRNGSRVVIDNTVQPQGSVAP